MTHRNVHNAIIKKANELCKSNFMDYPDYDESEPIDNIADALTIFVMESIDHNDTELISSDVYDYISENLKPQQNG